MKPSGIGGQAVMEGVMMKNKSEYAVAVRTADQTIVVKKESYQSISEKIPVFKAPFLRGIVNFVESLYLGMKTLLYSASFFEAEEQKRKEEWEDWIRTGTGARFTGDEKRRKTKGPVSAAVQKAVEKFSMFLLLAASFALALALFMFLPMFLAEHVPMAESSAGKAVLEGILRLLIFFLYLFLISRMEDIERVFMYHGAEHKAINCVENGQDLTIENVRKQPRQHKRCGTSFLFLVIILSILFFVFIRTEILWQKIVFRLLLVPVIASVSYEFIRLAGRSENPVVSLLSKPGMWFQNLTTKEPDDDMIEVAIRSVETVFDWRAFLSKDTQNDGMPGTELPPEAGTEYYAVSEMDRTARQTDQQMPETDGEERPTGRKERRGNVLKQEQPEGEHSEKKQSRKKSRETVQLENMEEDIGQESLDGQKDNQKESRAGKQGNQRESWEENQKGTGKESQRERQKDGLEENDEMPVPTLSMITKERLLRAISKDEYNIRAEEEHQKTDTEQDDILLNTGTGGRLKPDNADEDDAILKALDKYFGE